MAKIELVATALGCLCERMIFVGGCVAGLLVTDQAAAPVRVTYDVDLVVRVTTRAAYSDLENEFERLGFKRDTARDAPICRWIYRGLAVDLVPSEPGILGFSNRWYPLAVETAQVTPLPGGATIRLITAPAFLAAKFEAHIGRGGDDLLASHDLEDIITVLDGRPELPNEIASGPNVLREYLAMRCRELLAIPNFPDTLPALIFPDAFAAERARLVAEKISAIAASAGADLTPS